MSEKVTIKVERKELHLPTIALRGLVVFPNNLVHFEVGREKSIAAVEWAMANNSNVFLVAQKEMETSEPTQQDLYTYGVVAEVKQVLRVSDELVKVLVEGKYRAVIEQVMECHKNGQPVLVGTVSVEKSETLAKMLQRRRFSAVCCALRSGACRKARRSCGDRSAAPRPQDRL